MNKEPLIVNIGDGEYITLYSCNVVEENLDLVYRYTGDKLPDEIEKLLTAFIVAGVGESIE